ncbi:hypothetical protein VIGAN_02261600 [Vigna angularis var. angularis]|uniref:Uncharacterized protein n=1 Tax=Vigna angularis var. angularis TaxID=157739 RepID=A0A0S3RGS7_PHAAN|nr:hypothetical protein VIGAN_02261600 [Vigna angularis var. angularis]
MFFNRRKCIRNSLKYLSRICPEVSQNRGITLFLKTFQSMTSMVITWLQLQRFPSKVGFFCGLCLVLLCCSSLDNFYEKDSSWLSLRSNA